MEKSPIVKHGLVDSSDIAYFFFPSIINPDASGRGPDSDIPSGVGAALFSLAFNDELGNVRRHRFVVVKFHCKTCTPLRH